ncbi:39096_t:CDS:2, partial [Gigaspora margarita]
MKKINTFFEHQNTHGYKFEINPKGNVFIVEMEKAVHRFVVAQLIKYFEVPNGGVTNNSPIDIAGSLDRKNSFRSLSLVISFIIFSCLIIAHYQLYGRGKPFHLSRLFQYLEIPKVDTSVGSGSVISVSQSYRSWNSKCSCWMQQQYIRCIFRVKIYCPRAIQNAKRQLDQCIIVAPVPGKYIAVAGQVEVYYEKNFGTLDFYIGAPTTYMGPGL